MCRMSWVEKALSKRNIRIEGTEINGGDVLVKYVPLFNRETDEAIMSDNDVNRAAAGEKEKTLDSILARFDRAAVAFSGGTDSAYLLFRALTVLGKDCVLAVTVRSELVNPAAVKEAVSLTEKLGVKHMVLDMDLLSLSAVANNLRNRCYYCKKAMYKEMRSAAAEQGRPVILDGSHAGDQFAERPGMHALAELEVHSPLREAALDKKEIRVLSREAGLPTWKKPAEACFASRFPYGDLLTAEKIRKVAEAEDFLRRIGLANEMRVRCHGQLARIEADIKEFQVILSRRGEIESCFRNLGFRYITLDLEGFASGSMDR